MALLTVQTDDQGTPPAFTAVAVAGGDQFLNDGRAFLLIQLPTARTLTVTSPHSGRESFTQTFAAGSSISPRFDPLAWNDRTTSRVTFSFDNPTGVTVAVVRTSVVGFAPSEALLGALL